MMSVWGGRFCAWPWLFSAVIWALDILLLLSLLALGVGWWLFEISWTFGSWTFDYKWHKEQIFWPVFFGLLRGAVAYGGRAYLTDGIGIFRSTKAKRWLLAYCTCFLTLMVVERILNLTDFDVHIAPIVMKSKGPRVEHVPTDPHLLWKFRPGSHLNGRQINRMGFREREVDPRKPPGVRWVICLGDSVTAQGMPGYSQYLHEMLTNEPPCSEKWEAFNMAVYGYSSLQGLYLFRLRITNLHPDVVTVSFGRNDHGLAAVADRIRMMPVDSSPFEKGLYRVLHGRLVGRILLHALDRGRGFTSVGNAAGVRVSPEDFRNNMRALVREIRAIGAVPVLVTAPRRAITQWYVKEGYARSKEEFQAQHDQYAEIVREVARELGAPLLDLQQIMAGPECDSMFAPDAVHFDFYDEERQITLGSKDQPGLRFVAREMYKKIQELCSNHVEQAAK
jgi:lysophospholipase L1-like esterase